MSHRQVIAFLAAVLLIGCRGTSESTPYFKAYDETANNTFIVIGAPSQGGSFLAGVATDVQGIDQLVRDPELGWRNVVTIPEATTQALRDALARGAAEAGPTGSLGIYMSGHGSEDGSFMTQDGSITWDEITRTIVSARTAPLMRLLVFNDSCFSGTWVTQSGGNGNVGSSGGGQNPYAGMFGSRNQRSGAMINPMTLDQLAALVGGRMNTGFRAGAAGAMNPNGITQMLVVSASSSAQTSADAGAGTGGGFTSSLRETYERLMRFNRPTATVGDMMKLSKELTEQNYQHSPQYYPIPESILTERLFDGVGATAPFNGAAMGAQPAPIR